MIVSSSNLLFQDVNRGNFKKFVNDLKARNPNVKAILAVGGWTDSHDNKWKYKQMMGSAANRDKFAE